MYAWLMVYYMVFTCVHNVLNPTRTHNVRTYLRTRAGLRWQRSAALTMGSAVSIVP